MSRSAHRIRKQRWLVRCDSSATAFELRQRLREDWQEFLLPAFERAFDQEFGSEEVIHLAAINCNLKVAPGKAMSELLPMLLQQQLVREMREILFRQPFLKQKSVLWRKSTLRQERSETLLRYLRTGSVTWEARDHGASSLTEELKDTCREQWSEVQTFLRNEQLSATSCFRLLQLMDPSDTHRAARGMLEHLPFSEKATVLEVVTMLLESGGKFFGRFAQLQLSALLLARTVARRKVGNDSERSRFAAHLTPIDSSGLDHFISALSPAAAALFQNLSRTSDGTEASETGNGKEKQVFRPVAPGVKHGKGAAQSSKLSLSGDEGRESLPRTATLAMPTPPGPPPRFDCPVGPNLAAKPDPPAGRTADRSRLRKGDARQLCPESNTDASTAKPSEAAADFPLMVSHSGLILLHPFLPQLFEKLGIKARNETALVAFVLPRASALLHFLATGQDVIFEYDIALIKVLLGVNPETALCVSEGLITEADKLEAETLLEAAVAHWPALKDTSIAGFRTSFLQRSALLRTDDCGWRLQVERKPFDMLLEHLLWSISVVKLPWMPLPLYSEW